MSNIIKQDNSGTAPVQSLQKQIDGLFSDFLRDFDISFPSRSGLVKTFQPNMILLLPIMTFSKIFMTQKRKRIH